VSTKEQIDIAISTMEEAMKALRELGIVVDGDDDE
jgi:hypothetical protein